MAWPCIPVLQEHIQNIHSTLGRMPAKKKKPKAKKGHSPVASRLRARGLNPIPNDGADDSNSTHTSGSDSSFDAEAAEFLDARMGSLEDSNAILQAQMQEVLQLLRPKVTNDDNASGMGHQSDQSVANAAQYDVNGHPIVTTGQQQAANATHYDVNGNQIGHQRAANGNQHTGGNASTTPTSIPAVLNQHIQAAIKAAMPAATGARSNATVANAVSNPAIMPPNDDDNIPLDDPAIIFRSDLWHEKVNSNVDRWMLLKSLKEECYTQVPKLNYQIEIHIKVIDMLLQERLDDAYALLCDRIQFLRYQANHSLEEAIHFWEQLRAIDKPQKYKAADIAALLMSKRKEKNYTPKQAAYLHNQLDHKNDQHPPGAAPQKGGSQSNAQGHQRQDRYWEQAGRKNGRNKANMWANKRAPQYAPQERGHGFGPF